MNRMHVCVGMKIQINITGALCVCTMECGFFLTVQRYRCAKFNPHDEKKPNPYWNEMGDEKNANTNWTLFLLVSNHSLVSLTTFSTWSWLLAYSCGFFSIARRSFVLYFSLFQCIFHIFFSLFRTLWIERSKQQKRASFFCLFDSRIL